jgi:hypothetical protein
MSMHGHVGPASAASFLGMWVAMLPWTWPASRRFPCGWALALSARV